ncbi:MAG: NifU family protein [Rhodospirillaceae bacterium]|nr:NifU family protein [Rhodospirillaceae bacterium]
MFIQTENTPNPATVKFLPGRVLTESGPVDCPTIEIAAARSPLAERLFQLDGVAGVLIGRDAIAVTKVESASWDVLKLQVMGLLVEHLSLGHRVLVEASMEQTDDGDDSVGGRIKALIESRVRPVVARDGGDIVFERFDDGVVYLRMKGACAGCPSATLTLKNGVEAMLKAYVPEVVAVRQVS